MKFQLTSKVLITGASRGIGYAILNKIVRKGFFVLALGRQFSIYELKLKSQCLSDFKIKSFCTNLANFKFVRMLYKKISMFYSNINIIINNAGITKDNLILRMSENDWTQVLNTNLSSFFYIIKNFIKDLLRNKWGRIVNISSVVALTGNIGQINYASAKSGILGLTKTLSKEIAQRNITVNAILPGFIETSMTKILNQKILDYVKNLIPMRRFGSVNDVSDLVLFCCSHNSKYITGHSFTVDGGLSSY